MHELDFETTDIKIVLDESRKLAIRHKHGFIDYNHLYVAIFSFDSEARTLCNNFDVEEWSTWLQQYYPSEGNQTMEDSLPLTVFAEHVIRHAYGLVRTNGDIHICSVHLLLALLCIDCEITASISKRGFIFEDIAEQYYQVPVKKSFPFIPALRKKPYSKWKLFFLTDESRKKKIEDLYSQAYELFLYQLYDDCLSVCNAGLSLKPDNHNFRALQLNCYVQKRDLQPSLYHASALINDHPDDENFKIILAYIYGELGRYNEADKVLDELLLNNPQDEIALNNKGFNLYLQDKFTKAVPFFERAIAINPAFAYPWNNLGFVQYKLGKVEQGLQLIDKSLDLDKGNSYAYKNKGSIFLELGKKKDALENFQLALKYGYTEKYGNEVLELIKMASI